MAFFAKYAVAAGVTTGITMNHKIVATPKPVQKLGEGIPSRFPLRRTISKVLPQNLQATSFASGLTGILAPHTGQFLSWYNCNFFYLTTLLSSSLINDFPLPPAGILGSGYDADDCDRNDCGSGPDDFDWPEAYV